MSLYSGLDTLHRYLLSKISTWTLNELKSNVFINLLILPRHVLTWKLTDW